MRIFIVGAGLAGLSAAWSLTQRGISGITIVDAADGPGTGASFANGALLHPSFPEPWNAPGIAWQLLRDLGNEDAAALVRLKVLPTLVGWGLRFLRESSRPRWERNTLANMALARHGLPRMAALREAGVDYAWRSTGSLMLLRSAQALDAFRKASRLLEDAGLRRSWLTPAQAVALEPALATMERHLAGAVHNLDDERGDAHAFCRGLAQVLADRGVNFRWRTPVLSLTRQGRRVTGARTVGGASLEADTVVMAAASHSAPLLRSLGLDLPVRPAKGYSLTFSARDPQTVALPRLPVIDAELHAAIVPVGDDRLRIAGTAEFCGFDTRVVARRVDNLARAAQGLYPMLGEAGAFTRTPWAGLRPMGPDGVPLVGPTRLDGLWLNTGHGHLGWTQATGSGELLADLLLGRAPGIDAAPYAPGRFGV